MARPAHKYYRTIVLGVLAMAALVWSAVDQFGIPWEEMLDLFLAMLLALVLIVMCSAVVAALWMGVRRLLRKDDS